MQGTISQRACKGLGIECVMPEGEEMQELDRIIWSDLLTGKVVQSSVDYYVSVIERHSLLGCDAVVLGCTEIPLLISDSNSPLPTLDSTRLLAKEAVRQAIG